MRINVDPMSEDLRRQRRNLVLVSFVLCFMKYGGVSITKTSVLGSEIQFSNTSSIFFGVWLLWIYFFIRYYQYFMQEGLQRISIALHATVTEKCRPKIRSLVTSQHPNVEKFPQTFDYYGLIKDELEGYAICRVRAAGAEGY